MLQLHDFFRRVRKIAKSDFSGSLCVSVRLSVHTGKKTRLPTDGFSRNLIYEYFSHYHHHHVHECLGVFPVLWSSRWSWSLHLFHGRPMLLRLFGLYCSACRGQRSTRSQGLYRCWYVRPINPEKTNRNKDGSSVGKSYSHVNEG